MSISKKYKNLMFEMANNWQKRINAIEFFNSEYKKFRVEETKTIQGREVQICVIPRGTRITELKINGGALAQPWFSKVDKSRVFIHEELLDFSKECEENRLFVNQAIDHEIGHLVSMSNDFTQEFDNFENLNPYSGVDEKEIQNIKNWIEKHNLRNEDCGGITFGQMIDSVVEAREDYSLNYIMLREHCANWYSIEKTKERGEEPIFVKSFGESMAELSLLMIKNIEVLEDLQDVLDDPEFSKNYLETFEEISKPIIDTYLRWAGAC